MVQERLKAIVEDVGPVFFIENKLLYLRPLLEIDSLSDLEIESSSTAESYASVHTLRIKSAPPAVLTLTAYGYMAELAREAMVRLAFENELFCELVVPSQLSPLDAQGALDPALAVSLRRTGRLLTIEEGTYTLGWGAEILARTAQAFPAQLKAARRLAAADQPIPASIPLEEGVLPGIQDIVDAARSLV